jgi:hypothetical protein
MILIPAFAVLDFVNTIVQACTLLVFVGTAVAALVQIRHLRASNELEAILALADQMQKPELQHALRYVQGELEARLGDAAYRGELAALGYIDPKRHPEMDACNWFNELGTIVKNRLVERTTFLELYARLVTYYWERLVAVVAILRRERGPAQYENFEYLALLAQQWIAAHPKGNYPAAAERLKVPDVWHDADAAPR